MTCQRVSDRGSDGSRCQSSLEITQESCKEGIHEEPSFLVCAQEDVNGEKLTVKKWWIFGADFSRFTQSFSRFTRDINGEKKISLLLIFSRLAFDGLPPLDVHTSTFVNVTKSLHIAGSCRAASAIAHLVLYDKYLLIDTQKHNQWLSVDLYLLPIV